MNTNPNPLVRLALSRKALITFFTLTSVVVLAALGKIKGDDAITLLTVVVPTWLLAQGYEDGKVKSAVLANAKPVDPPNPDAKPVDPPNPDASLTDS